MAVSSFCWSGWLRLMPGQLVSRAMSLGGDAVTPDGLVRGTDGSPQQGFLLVESRVRGAYGVRVNVSQPNRINDIEGVDLPTRVGVNLPVQVSLSAPEQWPDGIEYIEVFVSVSTGAPAGFGVNCRRLEPLPLAAEVAVPSWAESVWVLGPDTATGVEIDFLDVDGASVGSQVAFQGATMLQVPGAAVRVKQITTSSADSLLLFSILGG